MSVARIILFLFIVSFMIFPTASAASMKITDIPLGKVISLNGQKFVKVRNDQMNGSQFLAIARAQLPCKPNTIPYFTGTMQAFTTANCNSIPTPSSTCYYYVGTLRDSRDGKSYEIRKFADDKCWMVDNLKYGGATDACASRTTFSGYGSATPSNRFGAGTYGDCRNNPGPAINGYLYNWQAVVQHASAYYNNSYQPPQPTQGICPVGWHIPTGSTTGEYHALHTAVGSPWSGFWQPGGNWKGVYSDLCTDNGIMGSQDSYGFYWSSTQSNTSNAYLIQFFNGYVDAGDDNYYKYGGMSVRCIKN